MLIVGDVVFLDHFWTRTSKNMSPIFSTNFSRSNFKVKVQNPYNALFGPETSCILIRNAISRVKYTQ